MLVSVFLFVMLVMLCLHRCCWYQEGVIGNCGGGGGGVVVVAVTVAVSSLLLVSR